MNKKTVRDIDLAGKLVFDRVDYNVPLKDGEVGDRLRIEASFDTINYLLEQNCRIVLASHLGRPDGKPDPKYSLEPVAKVAAEMLGRPVAFCKETVGPKAKTAAQALKPGQLLLLENLRFFTEEESNDPQFGQQLAELGEVYVDDAFAAVHRAHASLVQVPKHLPAVSGLLLEKEVDTVSQVIKSPKRPLVAIVGGAKISDKIEFLDNLVQSVDCLLIGGAMANTFLGAQHFQVGQSHYEPDQFATARRIMQQAQEKGVKIILPLDVVVTAKLDGSEPSQTVDIAAVKPDQFIVDLGSKTLAKTATTIAQAGTVVWNGPLGITEVEAFAAGSKSLAEQIIQSEAFSLIGGGDTAAFIDEAGLHNQFDFVSTGGGAALDLLAGKSLPGVEALLDK